MLEGEEGLVGVVEDRSREVAALAAEVQGLRMALGCVRIVADSGNYDLHREIIPICDLALGREEC